MCHRWRSARSCAPPGSGASSTRAIPTTRSASTCTACSACSATRSRTASGVTRVDTTLAPAPVHLGVLGISGLTAYFGLLDVGQTRARPDRRRLRCRRVGRQHRRPDRADQGLPRDRDRGRTGQVPLAGRGARIRRRHRLQGGRAARAASATLPDGVDVFFDNVGGEVLEEVLRRLARGARVVISGAVSQYNATEAPRGPANYMQLLVTRSSMTGFVIFDYADRYPEGVAAARGMAPLRRAAIPRGRRAGRHRPVPRRPPAALPRREHRQARPRDLSMRD